MEVSSAGDEIYVFGGHRSGEWLDTVLIYRIVSDTWTEMSGLGYPNFTRTVLDYSGKTHSVNFTDLSLFRSNVPTEDSYAAADVKLSLTTSARTLAQLPVERGM